MSGLQTINKSEKSEKHVRDRKKYEFKISSVTRFWGKWGRLYYFSTLTKGSCVHGSIFYSFARFFFLRRQGMKCTQRKTPPKFVRSHSVLM